MITFFRLYTDNQFSWPILKVELKSRTFSNSAFIHLFHSYVPSDLKNCHFFLGDGFLLCHPLKSPEYIYGTIWPPWGQNLMSILCDFYHAYNRVNVKKYMWFATVTNDTSSLDWHVFRLFLLLFHLIANTPKNETFSNHGIFGTIFTVCMMFEPWNTFVILIETDLHASLCHLTFNYL